MPRIRKEKNGCCLFVGGPLNFSWQPVASGAIDYDFYTYESSVYDKIIFCVAPRPGMTVKPFSVMVYVLRGVDLKNYGWASAAEIAILRKFGYMD